MKNIVLITILSFLTSCYSYKQATVGFKNFENNNNYKIIHNNTEKEIKVLNVENDSIKIKYYDYNNDMQSKKYIEKISIIDIQNVKTQKFSLLKTSGLTIATLVTAGYIYYSCCFELNLR